MPKRVLICEDDPLLVDLLQFRLAASGYDVIVATDGAKALERLAESTPDAVVLDAMMPGVDGLEVLRRIRQNEATGDVPVIMLSARKQEQDILTALRLGASDYVVKLKELGALDVLQKPFDPMTLSDQVRAAYRKRPRGD